MTKLRTGTAEEAGMRAEQIELIEERATQWVQGERTPTLSLLVARHGVVCLQGAWGPLTIGEAPLAQTDSYWPFASTSKPITAAAVMTLVEEGLLGLTRPVQFYIPELQGAGTDEILVQHLLTHTSGFDDDEDSAWMAAKMANGFDVPPCPDNQDEVVHAQLCARYSLATSKPPGREMVYANTNYDLLGEIIRRVSGLSFPDFLAQRIFDPLGMTSARVGFDRSIEENMVCNFDIQFTPDMPTGDELRALASIRQSSGAVYGTVGDLGIFAQMILNGGSYGDATILRPATVAQMTRNQTPGIGTDFFGSWKPESSWSYGFSVMSTNRWAWYDGTLPPNGVVSHGGLGGIYFWVDPTLDLIGLYFSYCADVDPETGVHHWDADLFQNMVTAAVADEP